MTGSRQTAGRPIVATPVQNVIGLMRHLVGSETGANLRVAAEIETIAGRQILAAAAGTPGASARRISDFIGGRKPIPDWVARAAHQWCVKMLSRAMKDRKITLALENSHVRLSAAALRELMAEGLVGALLSRTANRDEKGVEAMLRTIDSIRI